MNNRKRNIIKLIAIIATVFFCNSSFAQTAVDYSGIWNGKFYDNSALGNPDETYRFEVQIAQTGKGIEGVTYSYQSTRFYGKASHNGFIKTDAKKLVIKEIRMLEIKMDIGVACLMTCYMTYSKVGDDEFLEGSYEAFEENSGRKCPGGYVKLKKIKKSIFGTDPKVQQKLNALAKKRAPAAVPTTTKPAAVVKKAANPSVPAKPKNPARPTPPAPKPDVAVSTPKPNTTTPVKIDPVVSAPIKKDTPAIAINTKPKDTPTVKPEPITTVPIKLPPPPAALVERKTEVAQSISVQDTSELVLKFYDYGEVDGDVVTIYVNNVAVVTKAPLTSKAILVPIKLDASNPVVEVVMYADNMGTIPPNTAYMTVLVNGKRYEATIESTDQKNASIRFVYESIKSKK